MFTTAVIFAGATCAAALITVGRVVGLRTIAKHSTKADVAFTAGATFLMAGTLTGVTAAILAGLFMALILSMLKAMFTAYDVTKAWVNDLQEDATNDEWEYNREVYTRGMHV